MLVSIFPTFWYHNLTGLPPLATMTLVHLVTMSTIFDRYWTILDRYWTILAYFYQNVLRFQSTKITLLPALPRPPTSLL